MIGRLLAALAVGIVLAGCGGDAPADGEPTLSEGTTVPTATLPAAVADLFRRYDAILARMDYDDEQGEVRKLEPGDRALYVLWAVDGEINNGGFSQYLTNSTAELHDEAVANANLIGATKTAALLEKLPGVLAVERISEDRSERQRLVDGLTPTQEAALGELDEEWFAGISVEIEAKLIDYVREHPEAFSQP